MKQASTIARATFVFFSLIAPASANVELQAIDIEGRSHLISGSNADGYSVVVFVSTNCPVANSYQPTLDRMYQQFKDDQVRFFQVHPSPRVTKDKALQHVADYSIRVPVILDSELRIASKLNAQTTPEAFLLTAEGDVLYRGRIDDLYTGFGKKRRSAIHHDLRDAIRAAIDGKAPTVQRTKSVGCLIQYPKADPK